MNKIVRATAGAGKTTNLLSDVYELFLKHMGQFGVPPKMLISTFTVKAAQELSERLIQKAESVEDQSFLEFTTSTRLDVGTMHSVFAKTFNSLKSFRHDEENQYVSAMYKTTYSRSVFRRVVEELELQREFNDPAEEEEVLDLFWSMRRSKDTKFNFISKDEFFSFYKESLAEIYYLFKHEDSDLFEKIKNLKNISEGRGITDYVLCKIEEGVKGKASYKKLLKFLEDEKNNEEYLKRYFLKQEDTRKIYQIWNKRMSSFIEKNNLYTLEDVESEFYQFLVNEKPEVNKWDYCFFDEYQDTSPMQKEIIDLITKNKFKYYVGDPFQSIYFFRGARKEIFDQAFSDIENSKGEALYNVNNYRSAPSIVKFVNKVSNLMLPSFVDMDPQLTEQKGFVEVAHFEDGTIDEEISHVYNRVKEFEDESVVVLSRTVKNLVICAKFLKSKGVEVNVSISKGLESSLEIFEIISFLCFLTDQSDEKSLLVLLMSDWFNFTDEDVALFKEEQREGDTLWNTVSNSPQSVTLRQFLEDFKNMAPSLVLNNFFSYTGFLDLTESIDSTGRREKNIIKFFQAICDEESKPGFSLKAFCDDILNGHYPFESEQGEGGKLCTLMTVHGSKGLQFDHVFIIGANASPRSVPPKFFLKNGVFSIKEEVSRAKGRSQPLLLKKLLEDDLGEEDFERRRLFYVAMTRAKKGLYIIGSKKISKSTSAKMSWLSYALASVEGAEDVTVIEEPVSLKGEVRPEVTDKVVGFLENREFLNFFDEKKSSVTGLIEQDREEIYSVSGGLNRYSEYISEGTLFHELMERVSDEKVVDNLIKNYFGSNDKRHKEALDYIFSNKEVPFGELLKSGHKEWGFDSFDQETKAIKSGKIDLWGVVGKTVWVVDYKTGSLKDIDKGFSQLQQYEEILKSYNQDSNFNFQKVLCFPYHKKTFIS